ncbi:uncharacterized protein LOC114194784 [Vigna unguiculata]|uniref:uncharacterized protein LOC114194784 n=1 Tax=Vigna unguiculata TaxID=3917 RepID=UPI001016FC01|nr:uncharacterized protein LOC114194784 [Vigna unguiculata]
MDSIVEEVGEENVIQVVTDNAANYKAAGHLLMTKRKRLFWTPCAAHCVDLMLEDYEKKIPIHEETIPKGRDLVRPGVTRFATSYLTLGCLHENKGALIRMFTSNEWKSSKFAKTNDGKIVEDVVLDKEFWKNIITCLKGAFPLIEVLRLVDSDQKPAMGFIYEAMDQAKEKIQKAFNAVKKRWDKQLHRPLHAAGYFLNPQMHYRPGFKADLEVKRGLMECITRMVEDEDEQTLIMSINLKTPADWWESYGDEYPELQKIAIHVLSLTCSSSGCERNWSSFEMVHTKRRNRLKQSTMNDVFVMANSKLAKKKQTRKPARINIDDCSSDEEWIMEDEHEQNEALDLDENLIPVEVQDDETLHSQDLDMTDLNDERDRNDGAGDCEFNLEDYLV